MQDSELTEQFLDALWIERNLAQNTLSSYRQDLQTLTGWLAHHQLTLLSVTPADLQQFLAERLEGGYKATSSARLLSDMRINLRGGEIAVPQQHLYDTHVATERLRQLHQQHHPRA